MAIAGRNIAGTFWGKAWCDNLEAYSDYANRLPRGRTYVRNGSVIDLQLREGYVEALVSGSDLYKVKITITPLHENSWSAIQKECTGRITSLMDLLAGRLSGSVMEVVTKRQTGLFPMPKEMSFHCSCPDWASMCKHVAAVLYGVGARLDNSPELLFVLRGVDHGELISTQSAAETIVSAGVKEKMIADDQLSEIFGIDIDTGDKASLAPPKKRASRPKTVPEKKKITKRLSAKKKAVTQAKKKEPSVTKKTENKKPSAKQKMMAKTSAKKKVTILSKKTANKGKRQPPKKTAAKTTAKKISKTPIPVRVHKPKRGKVETKSKA